MEKAIWQLDLILPFEGLKPLQKINFTSLSGLVYIEVGFTLLRKNKKKIFCLAGSF